MALVFWAGMPYHKEIASLLHHLKKLQNRDNSDYQLTTVVLYFWVNTKNKATTMETKLLDFRKRQTLFYTAFRYSKKQIAEMQAVSPSTVDKDLRIVYKTLNIDCLVMAVLVALATDEISLI